MLIVGFVKWVVVVAIVAVGVVAVVAFIVGWDVIFVVVVVVVVIWDELAESVAECECDVCCCTSGEIVHTVNNILGHGEGCPVVSIQHPTGG